MTYFSAKNGVEDGLVNYILQDRKGLLWFATWNGLSRFDGYSFKNYKSGAEDREGLTNNRLLYLDEDKYGCLWVLCYDSTAYRFNSGKEIFEPVHKALACPGALRGVRSISVLPNGSVWLMQSGGHAIRVHTDPEDLSLSFETFSPEGDYAAAGQILSVFADKDTNEWILTDNGLYRLRNAGLETVVGRTSGTEKPDAFYAAAEQDGKLLFGAGAGRVYRYSLPDGVPDILQLPTSAPVIFIYPSPSGKIVYVTDQDGLYVDYSGEIRRYAIDDAGRAEDRTVVSVEVTGDSLIWLSHPAPGVTWFDMQAHEFRHFVGKDENGRPLETESDFFVTADRNGILWVHPKGGGFSYYDADRKQLIPFNTNEQAVKWKSNDRCYTAFADKQGNLWMSTQLNRLKRVTFTHDRFNIQIPDPSDMDLPDNEIRALYVDRKGRIWTGSRNQHISVYDSAFHLLNRFKAGRVYAITQDSDGAFWISTKGDGLMKVVETADNRFKRDLYVHKEEDPYSLGHNNIYCTFQDRGNRLWVATYGRGLHLAERLPDGSICFINHGNRLKNYPIERFNKVRHITQDREGRIWVSTTAGILYFDGHVGQPEEIVFHSITREQGSSNSLSNNDVHMVKCTDDGRIYAITYGGGLNELVCDENGRFACRSFTQGDGLISDIIYSVQEDPEGNLWLATGGGLVKFISAQDYIQYPSERIAFNMHFSEGAGAANGKSIYFGTNRGILYFRPDRVHQTGYVPPLFFSSIWVDNEELTPKKTPRILTSALDDVRHVILPPNNHSLRIVFSALDMTGTEYIKYACMLSGFDEEYRYTDGGREANYTNLPPGKYLFHVKSTDDEGVWMDNEKTLSVEVLPAFAETPYARLLLVLLIVLITILLVYIYTVFYRMKQKIKNEELMAQLKLNFFTDVSHELRTPLTLISAPLEFIIQNEPLSENLKNTLGVIKKNSDRMQQLVGQIMDFSKIQNNKMRLRIQYKEIAGFTEEIVCSFLPLARERNINLTFDAGLQECNLWFDADKMEKIIFNLLSNAFKYTPDGKTIRVSVEEGDGSVIISIADQGVGIPKEKQERIFNRFDNLVQDDVHAPLSTGIGLSLAKELTELHGGRISVESAVGKGSVFSVKLLKGKAHYALDVEYIPDDLPGYPEVEEQTPESPENDRPLMLIVEDNDDLRIFIKQVFREKFRIVEANNGNDGLEKAFSFVPDILITDIMMPEKDGLQMLKELKDDERTSHIPAIVLTAKSNIESVLTGIRIGADDYIVKPFSISYLQAKIDSLIAQRQKMQAYYAADRFIRNRAEAEPDEDPAGIPGLTPKDEVFLSKLSEIMEQNMDNADLNVDFIVGQFNLSRTNFFNKLKSLTGLSPVLYIRERRMQRAAGLIKERLYSMSEIAYMVGYNDPHYFSKCFKSFWGMTCTEYTKAHTCREKNPGDGVG